ncbi:MAG: rod shape-determining protein [Veillonella sp.]|nr:rod shape-determining protein [Veillonella sp.]
MSSIISSFGRDVCIDMGTVNTRVLVAGRSLLEEPSVLATDPKREGIVAVGLEAESLIRRRPDELGELWPLREGFIVDYRVTHTMLNYFMHKVSRSVRRSRAFMAVPCHMTDVEMRAVMDAVMQAGARETYLIENPVAAALGCDLPVFDAVGSMVVDIGGGTTDIAVLSLGGVVAGRTIPMGGNDWNASIFKYLKECFSILVSDSVVEEMKQALGSAIPPMDSKDDFEYAFTGRDTTNGLKTDHSMMQSEMCQILNRPIQRLLADIKGVMRQTPPELLADIMENGIVLTGGGAQLPALAERLSKELSVPVRLAEDPCHCAVKGLSLAAKNTKAVKRFIVASRNRKGRT